MHTQKKYSKSLPARYDFKKNKLDESSVNKNPFRQFEKWLYEAVSLLKEDAYAMTLATSSLRGEPTARTVYLRGLDKTGFRFFTNYNSAKGEDLQKNKNACLLFYWKELQRQVRITGTVEKLSPKESDKYFKGRPRESQIAAWASQQSDIIAGREVLESWVREFTALFNGKKVPRPIHWGGYRLLPEAFEFWQGRENRLHDRIIYTIQKGKDEKKAWKIQRRSP